jgi:Mg-chelatase subunit ChlD
VDEVTAESLPGGEPRRSISRGALGDSDLFRRISPSEGELDEAELLTALGTDPDEALSMLAELTAVNDEDLRERARRLAGRLMLDFARRGAITESGFSRRRLVAADIPGSELDVEASLEAIVDARGRGGQPKIEELRANAWGSSKVAVCLLVDRSGSMGGTHLATASLAAAACALRAPDDNAVLAFGEEVTLIRRLGQQRSTAVVVDDLLGLRGRGTTDLGAALRAAASELGRSRATRKLTILLSDCEANKGEDPVAAAGALEELLVVGPDVEQPVSERFRRRTGARGAVADGPAATVHRLAELLR